MEAAAAHAIYTAPTWFLSVSVLILGFLFWKSSAANLKSLNLTISELKKLIEKVFHDREEDRREIVKHGNKIVRLETSLADCQSNHRQRLNS